MKKKAIIFILFVINSQLICGNEFYNVYKSNFIDKWDAVDPNNKEEKAKLLQQQLKDIRNYNPRKLRKLVALKIIDLGAKSDGTYRVSVNAGLYLAKSGLLEGPEKIALLIECEKLCSRIFAQLKFSQKEKKLEAAKDNYFLQKMLIEEYLKVFDYNNAKAWLNKLAITSESVRDPKILKTIDETFNELKGQVESCSKIYKQLNGKFFYTGSLRARFNHHIFLRFLSPSLSLPYYEESKDSVAAKHLKTYLAFQNKGKKVLKSPHYLCAKDTNLPPKLLLARLSKINKIKDSAQFIQKKLDEGRHQYYSQIIISTYELINQDGVHLSVKGLNLKPFFEWAFSIMKGIEPEILFNYIPKMIKIVNDPKNGLNENDRDKLLSAFEKELVAVKKKLHLYIFQNEPALKIDRDPKVKEWYSKSIRERKEIIRNVYNKLIDTNGGPSKGVHIHELSLRIDSSCTYESFWPLVQIPFTHVNIHHFSNMTSLDTFKNMPLENVDISWSAIGNIKALSNKKNLRRLNISGSQVKSIDALKGLDLTNLSMTHLRSVSDLSALEGMPLSYLNISRGSVNSFKHLRGMPLQHLRAEHLKSVRSLGPLEHTLLRNLNINGCTSIKSLVPLKKLKLNYLHIEDTSIEDLSPLSRMALESLYFTKSYKIKSLTPVRWMQIKHLGISHHYILSQAITYHFPLKSLKMSYTKIRGKDLVHLKNFDLVSLEMYGCSQLKDLRALKLTPSLKSLNISSCKNLKTLRGVSDTNIEKLYMSHSIIKDFSRLADSKITKIEARHSELVSLKGISKIPIFELDITSCHKLLDISEMPESSIKKLKIRSCSKIKDYEPLFRTKGLRHDYRN